MLQLIIGRAKTGKSEYILQKIAENGETRPQILFVPEHASHQAEVDLCTACGPTASRYAEVLSFRLLASRVLSLTGGLAEVTPDSGGKLLLLQRAMSEAAPLLKCYRKPSQKAAFLEEVLGVLDEFRSYEVSPEQLEAQAQEIGGAVGEKLSDLALLYGAYEAKLYRPGRDARDRLSKLNDVLGASHYLDGKDVYIDGFTYFNGQEQRALFQMLQVAHSVTVTLLGEKNSRSEIFEAALKTQEQLIRLAQKAGCKCRLEWLTQDHSTPLGYLEQHFFGKTEGWEKPTNAIRLREADTAFSEVEQTAADILRLVAGGKCRFRDVTVAARNMTEYEAVIETVFERYGIPAYLSRRSDILEKPALTMLLGALSAVCGRYGYEEMFRYLKTGLAGLTLAECDVLENYVLTWEIDGGMWLRDADWTANPDGYQSSWTEEQTQRLETINVLRRRVREPLLTLSKGLKEGKTVSEKIETVYDFLECLHLQEMLEHNRNQLAEAGELQVAEETAQLWSILCDVLDQFMEVLGDTELDADSFIRLLRLIFTQYSIGTIPVSLDQVTVSEITRNDRHTAKYAFLLGANDSVLPAVGQSGGILNESDRQALARNGVKLSPSGMEQMGIELQYIYAALAQPTEGLCISYPIRDLAGAELRPAFVIGRIQTLFSSVSIEKECNDKSYRFTAKIPALESAGREIGGELWRYFAKNPDNAPQLAAMERAAHSGRGRLSREAVRSLYGDQFFMSASRAERLRSCHFAYFMEYGLKAKERKTATFDAPQIGTFLHYILENVCRDVQQKGGFGEVDDETVRILAEQYMDGYARQELSQLNHVSARFHYLFNRLRETVFSIVGQTAEELRHSDFVPVAFELSFGRHGDLPAVEIYEPDGRLQISGKVDRVDGWLKDNQLYLRVVDYKTGKRQFSLAEVRMGLDMQMLLYLFTLQRKGSAKFGHSIAPAGVLYFPARDEILSAQRNITSEKLQQERQKALRRTGLLLNQPEVLQAMEHEALTEPQFLPIRVNRSGTLSGSIASASQLGRLGRYVESLLHSIAREMRDGVIDADPWCHNESDSFCRFCPFASVCHFEDGRDSDHLRYIHSVKPEAFWAELEQQTKKGESEDG